jgi:hypothetical protein
MSVQNKPDLKAFLPLVLIFVVAGAVAMIFADFLEKLEIDRTVLIAGNIILFAVTTISYFFHRQALLAGNTQVFLRNVYSGMFLRFFVCLIAAFIYIMSAGNAVNKGGLFSVMFLYFVYTFSEIAILLKQSRQIKENKNA